jgi:hypothetical protein
MNTYFLRLAHSLFDVNCHECGEVRVFFWRTHCAFCDKGEGAIK